MRKILLKNIFVVILFLFCPYLNSSFAFSRQIAITLDDLPFVGEAKNFHLQKIIDTIKAQEITITGFVIAGNVRQDNWETLRKFREAGFGLGNHTVTHMNLNKVNPQAYIQEIDAADKILLPIMTEPKYFRYPYLAMSGGSKKEQILNHLASKNYRVAPITIDSKDFIFNQLLLSVPEKERRGFLEELKPGYLAFIWQQTLMAEERHRLSRKPDQAEILLIHANLLNAYVLPDIISLYKKNGFTFVSLDEALKSGTNTTKTSPAQTSPGDADVESFMAWD